MFVAQPTPKITPNATKSTQNPLFSSPNWNFILRN